MERIKKFNEHYFLGGTLDEIDAVVEFIKSKIPDSINKDIDDEAFKQDINRVIMEYFYFRKK